MMLSQKTLFYGFASITSATSYQNTVFNGELSSVVLHFYFILLF